MTFLGIDTSCYTTSIALVNAQGRLQADRRIVLPVNAGEKGLKQSTALFYHWRNLPLLLKELFTREEALKISAIAVSTRPRARADSYMPVFSSGTALAESLAAVLGVRLLETSHQEGHVAAGLWSAGLWSADAAPLPDFLVLHVSGGTTELLQAKLRTEAPKSYELEIIGGSTDIQAGQLIDRTGVKLGLPFPCGSHLEQLAAQYQAGEDRAFTIPTSVKGSWMSFSGAETSAATALQKKVAGPAVARAILHCIAVSVEKAVRRAVEQTGCKDVLLVGGVAANRYIRSRLSDRLGHRAVGARLHFPEARYCTDNAVGVSLIARSAGGDARH